MKKIQILAAVAAFMVAGASVYASNALVVTYRVFKTTSPATIDCPGTFVTTLPCAISTGPQCNDGGDPIIQYYTYREVSDLGVVGECQILKRQ